jgi:hypothetical protein
MEISLMGYCGRGSRSGWSLLGSSDPFRGNLIRLSANLLASTLSRQGFLHSALRARLEVEGVTLHFLDDVFRLNLAFEPPQGILDRLTFLQSNFCQTHHLNQNYIGQVRAYALCAAAIF